MRFEIRFQDVPEIKQKYSEIDIRTNLCEITIGQKKRTSEHSRKG